jgi:hypothetical protein
MSLIDYANAPHPLGLLRARHERPRSRRAANKLDELTPLHVLPQAQGRHPNASNECFDLLKPGIKNPLPQCTANVS